MKFGLTDTEYTFLNENLILPLKKEKARIYIFGSRARGHHHPYSDIDLLFVENENQTISPSLISKILIFFEDSHFPFKIDLVNQKNLAQSYRENIESQKIEL